ncbi:MAG: hypothetical protein CMO01_21040 [Thalassobius sp.]|nr:hypothetical protein [Thalassovita sp.]
MLFFSMQQVYSQQDTAKLNIINEEIDNYLHITKKNNFVTGLDFGMGIGLRNENINIESATAIVDFTISPKVGYYFKQGFSTGFDFDYFASVASFDYQNEYQFLLQSYNIFFKYQSPKGFAAEIATGYGTGKEKYINNGSEEDNEFGGYRYSLAAGLSSYWSRNVCFELMLKYTGSQASYETVEESFYLNGLSLNAGITVKIF